VVARQSNSWRRLLHFSVILFLVHFRSNGLKEVKKLEYIVQFVDIIIQTWVTMRYIYNKPLPSSETHLFALKPTTIPPKASIHPTSP
jgi:hypothetical protein